MKGKRTVKFVLVKPDGKIREAEFIAVRRMVESKDVRIVAMNDLIKKERFEMNRLSSDIADWW